jgi:hypothetical protein
MTRKIEMTLTLYRRFFIDASVVKTGKGALELDVLATADASSAVLLEKRFRRI